MSALQPATRRLRCGRVSVMSKKKVPVASPAQLTHNPFAALSGGTTSAPAQPAVPEAPRAEPARAERRGRLVLARETKRRAGRAVIVVRGFDALAAWDDAAVTELARELKQSLGCGGTVEDRTILLQGDRPAEVAAWLRAQGFRVDGVTA